ncbi:MAG: mono/diheme cytochrome c family protein, partial [Polaromonas sp.]
GNPRPFGMPPFMLVLSDTEVASLLTFLRSAWGNQASQVTSFDVNRSRTGNQR